jgi:hypothetical protein
MEIDCIRVLMFDLFGTCFDASSAGKAGILSYSEQIRPWRAWQEFADKNGGDAIACRTALPLWQPLNLPLTWASLPPFPDVSVAHAAPAKSVYLRHNDKLPASLAGKDVPQRPVAIRLHIPAGAVRGIQAVLVCLRRCLPTPRRRARIVLDGHFE